MKILIDNGHGANTPGKCSPDFKLREYAWARQVAKLLYQRAEAAGLEPVLITPEYTDISLRERCRRVNELCDRYGADNCLLISLHLNAAGADGKWHTSRGFSSWVARNASAKSKLLARLLWENADMAGLRGNRSVPPEHYLTANFAICRGTKCAAVLTENLFQDNPEDVAFLLSDEGKECIADVHLASILSYINIVK
ncbi:MAG: N-acetylmuramoyl-L-alanine amidase [Muribaculaceae bacterium]